MCLPPNNSSKRRRFAVRLNSNGRYIAQKMKFRLPAKSRRIPSCSVRGWLQTNKVFFEVAAATLIGIASVVVSWSALQVSEKALIATKVPSLPHFELSKEYLFDPNTEKYVEESLTLNNYGGPISNLNWTIRTFIAIEQYGERRGKFFIPVYGYYSGTSQHMTPIGKLATAVGKDNRGNFSDLYFAALNTKSPETGYGVHISLEVISEVSYEDRFGDRSQIYFWNDRIVLASAVSTLLSSSGNSIPLELKGLSVAELLSASRSSSVIFLESN